MQKTPGVVGWLYYFFSHREVVIYLLFTSLPEVHLSQRFDEDNNDIQSTTVFCVFVGQIKKLTHSYVLRYPFFYTQILIYSHAVLALRIHTRIYVYYKAITPPPREGSFVFYSLAGYLNRRTIYPFYAVTQDEQFYFSLHTCTHAFGLQETNHKV